MLSTLAACAFGLHLATYHADRSAHYNETNGGTYAQCDGWTAGHYRNSERKDSSYAGYTFSTTRLSLTVGLVSGYARGLTPMLIPSVRLTKHWRVAILPPIPKASKDTSGIHLMYDF